MYRTLSFPLNVQVEITWACDNLCRHCYNAFRHNDELIVTMTDDQIDIIVDQIISSGVYRCVVTGGEPLVVPQRTLRLIRRLRENEIGVALNTNMNLFTKDIGTSLMEMGVTSIMTSLTADTSELHDWIVQRPGAFEKMSENVRIATKMGLRVIINMVLTKWNIDRVRQTGDVAASLGAAKFGATRACAPSSIAHEFEQNIVSVEGVRESLRVLCELKERHGYDIDVLEHYPWCLMQDIEKYQHFARRKCTAGVTSCNIGADGEMRPCGHSHLKYGNVFEQGFSVPWMRMTDWRAQLYSSSCSKCKFFSSCTGGCPMEAMNSRSGRDPHCTGSYDVTNLPIPKPIFVPDNLARMQFVFCPGTRLRREDFGGIIGSGKGGITLVGHNTFQMLLTLQCKSFSATDWTIASFKQEEVLLLFARLSKQKLIREDV